MTSDKLLSTYKRDIVISTKLLKQNPDGIICGAALTIEEANDYLKVYGVEKAAFAEDGKASLYFFNKEIIRFNNLKNNASNRKDKEFNKSIIR